VQQNKSRDISKNAKLTFSACDRFRLFDDNDDEEKDVIDESDRYDELLLLLDEPIELMEVAWAGDELDKKFKDDADSGEIECSEAK
jgi:hypothetical protein